MTLRDRVERALRTDVAAALELDGTGIVVLDVEDGIARVRLGDICASCPASLPVMLMSLEQELRRLVPEVEIIEAVL